MKIADLDLEHRRSPLPEGLDERESVLVAHERGWCHDSAVCRLCAAYSDASKAHADLQRAELRAKQAEAVLESVISG